MRVNNLQNNRSILERSIVKEYIEKKNKKSKILVSNFWFIVISNINNQVKKYYINKNYFDIEVNNYNYLKWQIVIPKIKIIWEEKINNNVLYLIELENIRKYRSRFIRIKDVDYKELWFLLSNLHSLNFKNWVTYLHWNLHQSNFFVDKEWKLWIFDFVSMFYGRIEYDFAIIYLNSMYDDMYLSRVLKYYKYSKIFDYKIMYKIVLQKIIENIKLKMPVKDEWIDWLKRALIKIQFKILKDDW